MSASPSARRPGGAAPPGRAGPDPARLAGLVARLFLEVERGRRPLAQLEPLMTRDLFARLRAALPPVSERSAPSSVVAVYACPGGDRCDAAVVVRRGARVGSLAVRLERRGQVWRIAELARPEDHGAVHEPPALTVRR